jgi:hypothetical protein
MEKKTIAVFDLYVIESIELLPNSDGTSSWKISDWKTALAIEKATKDQTIAWATFDKH